MRQSIIPVFITFVLLTTACEQEVTPPELELPTTYLSADYDNNVALEHALLAELAELTSSLNAAEANAPTGQLTSITYPATLAEVTAPGYRARVEEWLLELAKAANAPTAFQQPGAAGPASDAEGGLLGNRLLDEYGLELEQLIEKGLFGAALYHHAVTIIQEEPENSASVDRLLAIFGANPAFDPALTAAAATYAKRRSDNETETGFFYTIRQHLLMAKAAIEAGREFDQQRDAALAHFLLDWEKSNFATVIFYCHSAGSQLRTATAMPDGPARDIALGDAMHAYAEAVAFASGFINLANKQITDAQIETILTLLLAAPGQPAESYRFLSEVTLLANLDAVIDEIQAIYGFTTAEVNGFFLNN